MSDKLDLTIHETAWHRNGVGGVGFNAVYFTEHDPVDGDRKMLGIVFDSPGECAVIQLNQAGGFCVTFGLNSWRGDHYEDQLRQAIETMDSSGSIRVGPFGIPTEPKAK